MPEPPRSRTDEWTRAITQARGQRPRRLSDELELLRAGKQWRQVPLTVGLLLAVVGGVVTVAHVVRSYSADVRDQVKDEVTHHDVSSQAHQSLRAEMRREWASVNKQLGELKARVTKLSDKTTRRRR